MLIAIEADKASEAFLEKLKCNRIELESIVTYHNPKNTEMTLKLRVLPVDEK